MGIRRYMGSINRSRKLILAFILYFIAGDGVFSLTNDEGDISLVDLRTNTSRILVKRADVKDVSPHAH